MRKFLLPATLMLAGLLATTGCAKRQTVAPTPAPVAVVVPPPAPPPAPDPVVTPEPESLTVTGDGFEVTLPEAGWVRKSPDTITSVAYLVNMDKLNRIIITAIESKETTNSLTLQEVRGARGAHFKVLSQKNVKSNGVNFTLLTLQNTNNADIKVWTWMTVKDHVAYIVRCGGIVSEENDQNAICSGVFKTFKLTSE